MTHPDQTPKRHKKQPTAEVMREQLRLAADEIIAVRQQRDYWRGEFLRSAGSALIDALFPPPRIPWYRRLWNRIRARVVEVEPTTEQERNRVS